MRAALLGATFGALVVVFAPLERVFPARPGQRVLRPAWRVDLCFFLGQYLAFAALTTWVLSGVAGWVDAHALHALRAAARARPLWIQGGLSLALGDVLVYWFHRACHRYAILWRFHAVHHSAEHLDWLAAYREHPLDGIGTQVCLNLPGIVLGLPFEAMGGLVVLRGLWAVFIHSNVRLPVGPLRFLLGAPELHHWHHLRADRTAHNFANLAPWLDVLFGTYHRPEGPETYPLGIPEPWPKGYVAQLVRPFLRAGGEAAPGGVADVTGAPAGVREASAPPTLAQAAGAGARAAGRSTNLTCRCHETRGAARAGR